MKTLPLLLSTALALCGSAAGQIRSVTRPTIQLPLGLPPILQPRPSIQSNAAPMRVLPPAGRRLTDRTPPEERRRRIWLFEEEQAARGLPSFQFSLAGRYLLGRGVPQDPERALDLIRKSAAQGYEPARRVLAEYERLVAERRRTEQKSPAPHDPKKASEQEEPGPSDEPKAPEATHPDNASLTSPRNAPQPAQPSSPRRPADA